ncbi:MAG: protein kinase [Deltaproteobacteria bacterium]|nr:protein kinase [Deltaproteobacteria bacterium]MBN2672548.1 protein kinase [Deltaproteobacteria bacterium]
MGKALFKLESGFVLDQKYRIEDIIGSGGMGYVYRATNIVLKREVAIKTLQKQKGIDDAAIQRFHQEAQIAASIGHDNICEVIDFGTDHPEGCEFDVYYLVMPLLNGKSLGQWFDSWVKPSPPVFIDIISQTLLGLHAAHTKRIVHRDLKPDNIFITNIGDRENFVKILDFGISKYLESDAALSLTKTGIAMGTPLYMSPEQAKGAKHIDHTTDLYAVGVVLYEGFVGQLPYQGDNFNDVLLQIASKPFPKPRERNPEVPKEIEAVILKAMSRAPVDRYENAVLMRQALMKAASSANINNRKSFVYPTSQMQASPDQKTMDLKAATPISENVRVQTRLKEMSTSSSGAPKHASEPSPSSTMLKALIAVIVLSLIAAIAGIAYIALKKNQPANNDANIVPAITPTAQPEVEPAAMEEPEPTEADTPTLTMPAQMPEASPVAARPSDETISKKSTPKKKKGREAEGSAAIDTDPDDIKVLSKPTTKPKKRTIERDVSNIFD